MPTYLLYFDFWIVNMYIHKYNIQRKWKPFLQNHYELLKTRQNKIVHPVYLERYGKSH